MFYPFQFQIEAFGIENCNNIRLKFGNWIWRIRISIFFSWIWYLILENKINSKLSVVVHVMARMKQNWYINFLVCKETQSFRNRTVNRYKGKIPNFYIIMRILRLFKSIKKARNKKNFGKIKKIRDFALVTVIIILLSFFMRCSLQWFFLLFVLFWPHFYLFYLFCCCIHWRPPFFAHISRSFVLYSPNVSIEWDTRWENNSNTYFTGTVPRIDRNLILP